MHNFVNKMSRPPGKRKCAEKWTTSEPGISERRKIKIEPEDDFPEAGLCCLCKVSSGVKLLALFEDSSQRGTDSTTAEKIKICIDREVSPETDPMARICLACLEELNAHHGFWKQALQCNDYAQNQMTADEAEVVDAPTEIRVCRFCLQIGANLLLDLFPQGEASNDHQLGKIQECLAIQMNPWDPVTKICSACVQRIEQFLEFRAKHVPATMYVETEPTAGSSHPADEVLQKGAQDESMDLDLTVYDSHCSVQLDSKREDPLIGVRPKLQVIRPEMVALLGTDSKERNFSAVLKNGEQLTVTFEDYPFRFHSMTNRGGTLWYCLGAKLRKCPVKLEIDPAGKIALITSKCSKHVHPLQPPAVMQCPIGKGFVRFGEAADESFWLFDSRQIFNNQTRSLIFAGYRYYLYICNNDNPLSLWHCGRRRKALCRAVLEVEGVFQRVRVIGNHNHAAMEQEKIDEALRGCPLDSATTEAIGAFQKSNAVPTVRRPQPESKQQQRQAMKSVLKEKNPEIFKVLQEEDSERNFECVNAGSKLKIKHEGFEYRYFGTQEDESTLWKCIMDSLHQCLMVAKLSADGKYMEMFNGLRHRHTPEPAAVFGYPLGKRMVGDEPLWMIKRFSIFFESRSVIFRDHVFILHFANKKGTVHWGCMKKHSCRALLIAKGDFQDIELRKDHSHEKTPPEILRRLLEGHSQPLSANENITFKQRLLSFPSMTGKIWDEVRNERETFYLLNQVKTGETIAYGLIFRGFRYSFLSLDQYGTSRWGCGICRVVAIIEGIYESIYIKDEHNHEQMLDSEMNLLIQRSTNNTLSEAAEGSDLVEHSTNESKSVLSILARQDPDRNFSVSRLKAKLLIHFEDEDFRKSVLKPDGTSLWLCTWQRLRKCPVVLNLSADCKQVTPVDPEAKHSHSEEQIAIFYLTCGKAPVYDEDIGADRSCWLFSVQSEYRQNRAIIYQGYKYCLHLIRQKGLSTWQCYFRKCKAFARVEDCLKIISCKNKHNHDPLSNDEILALTGLTEVDKDLLPDADVREPDFSPPTKGPLRPMTLLRLLSKNDSERNFQASIEKDKMKILQNGYEYHYHSSNETHSVWKCTYSFVRRCRVLFHIDNRCKQGTLPKSPAHNHPVGPWGIFCYPMGKHSIMDSYTETMKPFWYFVQPGFIRSYPMLIYGQNKYNLTLINGDNSRWRCTWHRCPSTLTVTGLFELIVVTGNPHNHELPSEEKVAAWIRTCEGDVADGKHDADAEFTDQIAFEEFPIDIEFPLKCEDL